MKGVTEGYVQVQEPVQILNHNDVKHVCPSRIVTSYDYELIIDRVPANLASKLRFSNRYFSRSRYTSLFYTSYILDSFPFVIQFYTSVPMFGKDQLAFRIDHENFVCTKLCSIVATMMKSTLVPKHSTVLASMKRILHCLTYYAKS